MKDNIIFYLPTFFLFYSVSKHLCYVATFSKWNQTYLSRLSDKQSSPPVDKTWWRQSGLKCAEDMGQTWQGKKEMIRYFKNRSLSLPYILG